MPKVEACYCVGRGGVQCIFSTSDPGKAEPVSARGGRCEVCKSKSKNGLASALAHLYILDYDIYQTAFSRVRVERRASMRVRIAKKLHSACPSPTNNCRRVRSDMAVDRLLDSAMYRLPLFMKAFQLCARYMEVCGMVRFHKKQPQDVFLNIAGGINVSDPSMDLGVIASILSCHG